MCKSFGKLGMPTTYLMLGLIFADFGADDMELYEALNEIIANSIDSWIEEVWKRSERPELKIEITTNTNLISVEDNAGGMNEDQLKAGMGLEFQ